MTSIPKRKLTVAINGKPYLVEIGDLYASPLTVLVNGQPYVVEVGPTEVEPAPANGPAAAIEQVARQTSAPPKPPRLAGHGGVSLKSITAPMPGHIVEILVKPGDAVSVGQELLSLEAMKMKNAIRSHRDGVVASVEVTPGQAVNHGDILVTFE